MEPHDRELLIQVHTAVCGVDGRGGLMERVEHVEECQEQLSDKLDELNTFKVKWATAAVIIVGIASFFSSALSEWIKKKLGI